MDTKNKSKHKIRTFLFLFIFVFFSTANIAKGEEEEEEDVIDENGINITKWKKDFQRKIYEESIRELKILGNVPISQALKNLIVSTFGDNIANAYFFFYNLEYNQMKDLNLKSKDESPETISKNFEKSVGVSVDGVKNKIVFIGSLSGPAFISTVLEWCIRHVEEIDYIVFLGDFCDHKNDNDMLYIMSIIFLFTRIFINKVILIHGDKDYTTRIYVNTDEKLIKKLIDIKLFSEKDGDLYVLEEGWIEELQYFYKSMPYNALFTFENGKRVYCAQNTPPFVIKETEKGEYIIDDKEYISGFPSLIHNEDEETFEKHNRAFSNRLLINNTENEKITKEGSRFLIPENFYEDFMVENEINSSVYCGKGNKTILLDNNTRSIKMVNSKILSTGPDSPTGNEEYRNEEENKASILVVEDDKDFYITAEDMLQEKRK